VWNSSYPSDKLSLAVLWGTNVGGSTCRDIQILLLCQGSGAKCKKLKTKDCIVLPSPSRDLEHVTRYTSVGMAP